MLDDKLNDILFELHYQRKLGHQIAARRKALVQIKQAFADEGYIKVDGIVMRHDKNDNHIHAMTGQDWYDRFWSEFTKTSAKDLAKHPELVLDYVLLVSKKASGL